MTRDDIIRMAREAGFDKWDGTDDVQFLAVIDRFAELIAASEREACAKVCDAEGSAWDSDDVVTEKNYAAHCAKAIRARGLK